MYKSFLTYPIPKVIRKSNAAVRLVNDRSIPSLPPPIHHEALTTPEADAFFLPLLRKEGNDGMTHCEIYGYLAPRLFKVAISE